MLKIQGRWPAPSAKQTQSRWYESFLILQARSRHHSRPSSLTDPRPPPRHALCSAVLTVSLATTRVGAVRAIVTLTVGLVMPAGVVIEGEVAAVKLAPVIDAEDLVVDALTFAALAATTVTAGVAVGVEWHCAHVRWTASSCRSNDM